MGIILGRDLSEEEFKDYLAIVERAFAQGNGNKKGLSEETKKKIIDVLDKHNVFDIKDKTKQKHVIGYLSGWLLKEGFKKEDVKDLCNSIVNKFKN